MKKSHPAGSISNRQVKRDYVLLDTWITGLQLSGAETKSLRQGHGSLRGAYVIIKDEELWLVNATISGSAGVPISESDQARRRKLLAKRSEIQKMITGKQQGLTLVPLELLTKSRYIKLKISLAKGKRQYDKRQTIRQRDEQRRIATAVKRRG